MPLKLIGSIHKHTTPEKLASMHAAGLTDVRLHLSKIPPAPLAVLAAKAADLGMGIYIDTRGNKPTALTIYLPGPPQTTTDNVPLQIGDRLYFGPPAQKEAKPDHKATFAMSYLPHTLSGSTGKQLTVDDGNIVLEILDVVESAGQVSGVSTEVSSINLAKVTAMYLEGISSFEVPIHSGTGTLFTDYDKERIASLSASTKELVTDVMASFAESGEQVKAAHEFIRKEGFSKARVVPKLETVPGIEHASEIAEALKELYGDDAEVWIGRGDLAVALLDKGHEAVMAAERQVLHDLKDSGVRVIVATEVAGSFRQHKTGQRLTATETAQVQDEIAQGAAGFVMASELYMGIEYAEEIIQAVLQAAQPQHRVVINIVGYSGVGKSTVCEYLVGERGFELFRPSDVIREYAKANGRSLNSNKDYVAIHKEINAKDPEAFVRPVLESTNPLVCIDGLRSPAPLAELRKHAGARTISLVAPIEVRLQRLQADATRSGHRAPKNLEELKADEAADLTNPDKGLPSIEQVMAEADYTIDTSNLNYTQVRSRIGEIIASL